MSRRQHPLLTVLFYLLVVIIFIYLMFPFYWALISALKPHAELIRTPATYWPEQITFVNFQAVFRNEAFMRGLLNSFIVATSVTLISLLVGSFSGFALGKLRFRGQSVSLYVILSMTMFPQIAVLSGLYAVINVLAGAAATDSAGARHHRPAGVHPGVERVPVRAHVHQHRTCGPDSAGRHRAVQR